MSTSRNHCSCCSHDGGHGMQGRPPPRLLCDGHKLVPCILPFDLLVSDSRVADQAVSRKHAACKKLSSGSWCDRGERQLPYLHRGCPMSTGTHSSLAVTQVTPIGPFGRRAVRRDQLLIAASLCHRQLSTLVQFTSYQLASWLPARWRYQRAASRMGCLRECRDSRDRRDREDRSCGALRLRPQNLIH